MTEMTLEASVAYCGYLCTACPGMAQGCPGCKAGGGDAECPQKACCAAKGLQGCWDCGEFPCNEGPYGSDEWRGLAVGCATSAKCLGLATYAERVQTRLGSPIDFGQFRGKSVEEVTTLLCDPEP
ncbi:MAG: DUF3795 domain-containing protein [Anaerolineae bacterium]